MASTIFTDANAATPGTVVTSSWLNPVDTATYSSLTSIGGTADAITATGPLSMTAYATGQRFVFVPTGTNTTNVVININGLGGRAITKFGNTLTVAGDIVSGMSALIVYDGTGFQLLNPRNGVSVSAPTGTLPIANGGTGATTVAGALANLGLVTQPTFRNRLINGDFNINQRQLASTTTNGAFFVDRWLLASTNTNIFATFFSTAGLTPNPTAGRLQATVGTAAGATNIWAMQQNIEGTYLTDLRWGTSAAATITISFWVRSNITGTFGVHVGNSAANRSYVASVSVAAPNVWEYKTVTIPGDTSGTWLTTTGVGLNLSITAGAGTNFATTPGAWGTGNFFIPTGATNFMATNGNTFDVTGVQLEVGSVATPYEFLPLTVNQLLCQRYYFSSYPPGVAPGAASTFVGAIRAIAGSINDAWVMGGNFPVPMRAAPSGTVAYQPTTGASGTIRNAFSGASIGLTAQPVANERGLYTVSTAGLLTVNTIYDFHVVASAEI